MPQNIGDAILKFFGDTSDLDQAFARIPAQSEAAMDAAAQNVNALGGAFQGVNFELDATAENVPFCGEIIKDTMQDSKVSVHEAAGEVTLLGELFGIHLPRHVRTFLGELPGVGAALSAAFAATAVIFLIEAVIQIVEKIKEFAAEGEKTRLAMEALDETQRKTFNSLHDNLLEAQERAAELAGNHLEALRLKLELINHQNLDNLDGQLRKITEDAQKALDTLDRNWFSKTFLGLEGSEEAKQKLTQIQEEASKAFATRTPEAYQHALDQLGKELDVVTEKQIKLAQQQEEHAKQPFTYTGPGAGAPSGVNAPDPKEIQAWEELDKTIQSYVKDIQEAQRHEKQQDKNVITESLNQQTLATDKAQKAYDRMVLEVGKAHAKLSEQLDKEADANSKKEDFRLKEQLKDENAALQEELRIGKQRLEAQIVEVDGEIKAREDSAKRQEQILKTQFDAGVISSKTYLAELKKIYDKELSDLIVMLNHKEQLVILEAETEAAQRGRILTEADAKELKGYQQLENEKVKLTNQFAADYLKATDQMTKADQKVLSSKRLWDQFFADLQNKALTTEQKFKELGKAVEVDLAESMESAFEAMGSGAESAGKAIVEAMRKTVADIAKMFAEFFLKKAIADMFLNPALGAAELAAGLGLAALAGAMGGGANAGGATGGAAANNQANVDQTAAANKAAPVNTATVNVPKLYGGAIVTKPTLAMVGDSDSGGGQTEGIFPLGDPRAMQAMKRLLGDGHSGIVNQFNVRGMISTQDLSRLGRTITRASQTGRLRLTVNNSSRITRRS